MKKLCFCLLVLAIIVSLSGWNPSEKSADESPDRFTLVRGGVFLMGDEFGDLASWLRPVHEVTLTYDFWIGKYTVVFDEYDAFCDDTGRTKPNDEGWGRETRPVINVTWWDAVAYCNWLSTQEGIPAAYDSEGNFLDGNGEITTDPSKVVGYRLPTEAEWEYAARGGEHHSPYRYSGSDDVDLIAWYASNSDRITHAVGQKEPNALGLYDMSGNVWEMCSDWYESYHYTDSPKTNPYNATPETARTLRGGSLLNRPVDLRVAARNNLGPTNSHSTVGFRVVRTAPWSDK